MTGLNGNGNRIKWKFIYKKKRIKIINKTNTFLMNLYVYTIPKIR